MSNKVTSEYIDLDSNGNKLKLEVYYNLGGINYFDYKTYPRGYYGSVTPVKVRQEQGYSMESYTAFSGICTLLVECKRKNKKSADLAVKLFVDKKQDLIAKVKAKLGIKFNGEAISKKLGFSIPPCFHHKTEEEIKTMPVQIVGMHNCGGLFKNLNEAQSFTDLHKLCGPMYGKVNDQECLRFETSEAYKALSS